MDVRGEAGVLTLFRAVSPEAQPWRSSDCASAEDARMAAVRNRAGDAATNPELRAQIWRSLARAGWRVEEIDASGRHLAWQGGVE